MTLPHEGAFSLSVSSEQTYPLEIFLNHVETCPYIDDVTQLKLIMDSKISPVLKRPLSEIRV